MLLVWLGYQTYKFERPKTRVQRLKDLRTFGLLWLAWFVGFTVLGTVFRYVSGAGSLAISGLLVNLPLAWLCFLAWQPQLRTRAVVVMVGLVLAAGVYVLLQQFSS